MDSPPADLQTVLRIMNEWQPMHTEDDLVKVPGNLPLLDLGLSLPHDINAYPFSRYATKYIRDHRLGITEDPIRFPFLPKFTAHDNRDSVDLFKLILSFMFDGDPREKRHLMLANYIIQKGLSNEHLRDEIYVQLVNQTIGQRQRSPQSPGSVWTLLASCLSAFPPSTQLANHLLKYVSDAGTDGFNAVCQHKLLQCIGLAPELARSYPPCLLEWTANRTRAVIALHATFADGEKGISQVESWTTAEEFAANIFRSRHVTDRITGWNVQLRDDVDTYECAGYDYVIDLISEMELPPRFPCSSAYFLTMTDLSRPASTSGRQHWPEEPHNAEHLRLMPLEVDELADQPIVSLPPPIHPQRARTPPPPRVKTPPPPVVPPPKKPPVVEEDDKPPTPPPLRPPKESPIQVNPDEAYIHSEQAISQGSALNRRKDHVPAELSKKSVLNSRYAAKVVDPEPARRNNNNQPPAHQKQAPENGPAAQQRQRPPPAPSGARQQPEQARGGPGNDDDMGAWVDNIFKQALGGQSAGHPVQDLGNGQALARNMKGGGDNLPGQFGLGAAGTGVYGIAPFGLQPAATIQPPSAFAQPVMPMMPAPAVLNPLSNPTLPGTLAPNVLSTGLPVSIDPTMQIMQHQQLLQQQQQQVQQAQQIQQQQQQQQLLQHMRLQQQQQMQIQRHAADLQVQLQVKELEKQVLTSSLQAEMLKQQLEQIQGKKERVTAPSSDALSKRPSFRDDAPPPPKPIRPASGNYTYLAPRPEQHQNHRAEGEVDEFKRRGVNTLKRSYLNKTNSFRDEPPLHRPAAAPVVSRHPQQRAAPAPKTKEVKFAEVSDEDDDDDDEATVAAPPRPRPVSPPIAKKEGKKVPVQSASKKQASKPAVPAVKAVPEAKAEQAPKKLHGPSSSAEPNGEPEPRPSSNAKRAPGKIGIKWPPEAEKADRRPNVEVNRLVITEVKEETPTVQRTQSTDDVQQKINNRIKTSQEAAQKKDAAVYKKTVPPPPPAPVKAHPKILTEEAGTQSENWSNVDMATKKKELEKMLKGVQWGTQRDKAPPPVHHPPPPPPAPPLPAATPPPPPLVPVAISPRAIQDSNPDNGLSRLDNIRTALHAQSIGPFYTYRHNDWTLEIKKEVFSPLEKLRNPILVDLVFAQVVGDVLTGDSIRINAEDKRKMKKLLDGQGVSLRNVGGHHSIQVKEAVIKAAKDLPLLFSRLFPVNGGSKYSALHMVGVSHSGVRLLARNKDVFEDTIVVFETIKFSEIVDVHVPKSKTLLMRLRGRNVVVYTKYATHMRDMLSVYRKEDSEIIMQSRMIDNDDD